MTKELSELFESEIRKGTFTSDALDQFNSILNQVKNLENTNLALAKKCNSLETDYNLINLSLSKEITRANQAEELSRKKAEAETRCAVAEAKADVYKECFDLIFRNAQVRESIVQPFMKKVVKETT